MTDHIMARRDGAVGHLSLNRPKAIHALTLEMVAAMTAALLAWRDDAGVGAVLIDHAPSPDGDPKLSRGFCAGGDIALLRTSALNDGGVSGRRFFFDEYRLNHLLFEYPKPVVAFMDGITMGGGVGISQPARFRVATENTRLAMPETGIGLFPDVGGGWYLSRLPGRLGEYLALTGARLDGAECLWAGLATHYLAAASLPEAKRRIAAGAAIETVLGALAAVPTAPPIAEHAEAIDRLFASDRYEDILAALAADDSAFAGTTLSTLRAKSPQSCKVSLRLLGESRRLNHLCDEMAMEYRVGSRVLARPDFAEGVRALIVDKTGDPAWNPAAPEGVSDDMIDAIFADLPANEEWTPL
ncbi:enoyl-CoA hydratase/isomerase family protein [Parablastomonas sp. CN1-191]|uniref:enoyl-CoA hydratase/isomerase family protein n=1 Tax=Parablastomonas sp. CN1-191 TaxID=3400908 RepID=UPI003BF795BE